MDLKGISELNQRKQILYDLTYMWNPKKPKQTTDELIDTENRPVVARGRE